MSRYKNRLNENDGKFMVRKKSKLTCTGVETIVKSAKIHHWRLTCIGLKCLTNQSSKMFEL